MNREKILEVLTQAGITITNGQIATADIDRAKMALSKHNTISDLKSIQKDFEKLHKSFQKPELEFAAIMDKLRDIVEEHPDRGSEDYVKLKNLYESLKGNMFFSVMSPLRKYDFRFDFKELVKRVFSIDL